MEIYPAPSTQTENPLMPAPYQNKPNFLQQPSPAIYYSDLDGVSEFPPWSMLEFLTLLISRRLCVCLITTVMNLLWHPCQETTLPQLSSPDPDRPIFCHRFCDAFCAFQAGGLLWMTYLWWRVCNWSVSAFEIPAWGAGLRSHQENGEVIKHSQGLLSLPLLFVFKLSIWIK